MNRDRRVVVTIGDHLKSGPLLRCNLLPNLGDCFSVTQAVEFFALNIDGARWGVLYAQQSNTVAMLLGSVRYEILQPLHAVTTRLNVLVVAE